MFVNKPQDIYPGFFVFDPVMNQKTPSQSSGRILLTYLRKDIRKIQSNFCHQIKYLINKDFTK